MLSFALAACSSSGTSAEDEQRARDEEAARKQAEEDAKRQAEEEAAEEARLERVESFCSDWAALSCRSQLNCHPAANADHVSACTSRLVPYCEDRMAYAEWDTDAAASCFENAASFDCTESLESFFTTNCNDVFPSGQAAEGEPCGHPSDCAPGTVCDRSGDCSGTCVVPLAEGQNCEDLPCDEGLACAAEIDDRGLDVNVCRAISVDPEPTEPEPSEACQPWEQPGGSGCIAKSLPGEACDGQYSLTCVGGASCENGTCSYEGSNGSTCFNQGDCGWPFACYSGYTSDSPATCKPYEESCSGHPMMLN
jgi:hypothetical protein